MRYLIFAIFALIGFLTCSVDAAEEILLYEPTSSTYPETLLICIPGMSVPAIEYEPVCLGIQKALGIRVWLGIMSFRDNAVNPLSIQRGLDMTVNMVIERGFTNVSNKDIFVWAHSAGGSFATGIVGEREYAGYLLYGSYLYGTTLENFPIPVITVGGELDGLTQISRVAEEYRYTKSLLDNGFIEEAISRKPVVTILGINHAQMANNYPQDHVMANDFEPEVSLEDAVAEMVKVAVNFILVHRTQGTGGAAFQILKDYVNNSDPYFTGFLKAQDDDEGEWCVRSQKIIANLNNADVLMQITNVVQPDFDSFIESKPNVQVTGGIAHITTQSYQNFTGLVPSKSERKNENLGLVSIYSEGSTAAEIGCKSKSQEVIVEGLALGSGEYGTDGICVDIHLAIFDWTIKNVPANTQSRYNAKGRQLAFLEDNLESRGDLWTASHLIFDLNSNPVSVIASRLHSPNIPGEFGGSTYCKGVAAARIVAWILHDSLPRGLKLNR